MGVYILRLLTSFFLSKTLQASSFRKVPLKTKNGLQSLEAKVIFEILPLKISSSNFSSKT